MSDFYNILFNIGTENESKNKNSDSNKGFFFTDNEGRVRFTGGPSQGGGVSGTLGTGESVSVGDVVYPNGNNAFRSTITEILNNETARVTLDVGSRSGEEFIIFLDRATLSPKI